MNFSDAEWANPMRPKACLIAGDSGHHGTNAVVDRRHARVGSFANQTRGGGVVARPARALSVLSCAVLGIAMAPSLAAAQSRGDCEGGIAFIRNALSQPQRPETRAELDKALRDAQRELSESEYDECLEAVEDARTALGAGRPAAVAARRAERPLAEDERVQVDQNFPVSAEGAGVPDRGEIEVRVLAGYSRLRPLRTPEPAGNDDDDDHGGAPGQRFGRDLTVPSIEAEVGLGYGLSAGLELAYAFGNAEEARAGEVELSIKWNFLPQQGLRPALTAMGGVGLPFGPRHGSSETVLGLLASQPLSTGPNAPFLHANILWFHALDREKERSDRYAASAALGVPIAPMTGLFVGYSREQESERRRANQFIELGVRQILPADFILGAGVGIGVGDSETDARVLLGLQKNF